MLPLQLLHTVQLLHWYILQNVSGYFLCVWMDKSNWIYRSFKAGKQIACNNNEHVHVSLSDTWKYDFQYIIWTNVLQCKYLLERLLGAVSVQCSSFVNTYSCMHAYSIHRNIITLLYYIVLGVLSVTCALHNVVTSYPCLLMPFVVLEISLSHWPFPVLGWPKHIAIKGFTVHLFIANKPNISISSPFIKSHSLCWH